MKLPFVVLALMCASSPAAQSEQPRAPAEARRAEAGQKTANGSAAVVTPPADYVIGPDDVLQVLFWKDKDLSGEVTVRPDGKISVPLLNDVQAAGLTPDQLRGRIVEAARRYVEDPSATVIVKTTNSRKVFITGMVEKPGPYPLTARTSVLQLIATAGGLKEYAKRKGILVLRVVGDREVAFNFDYDSVLSGSSRKQNIELKPGDTVVVP